MADDPQAPEETTAPQVDQSISDKPTMTAKVYAPFKIYFGGDITSLSAVNAVGPFDILPGHRNFLCMLVPCTLVIQSPAGEKKIKISRALMHVKADHVTVFMDV